MDTVQLKLPLSKDALRSLESGQEVLLSGPVYTMRDAGHKRALEYLEKNGHLPYGLEGQTVFYAGPTPPAAGQPFGSIGPTTASRMDFATPQLLQAGITGMIGKGSRSDKVRQACIDTESVYFVAVGGIAALLAKHVVDSETIAWDDLGTEALRKVTLDRFPVFVCIDTKGDALY